MIALIDIARRRVRKPCDCPKRGMALERNHDERV